MVEEIDMTDESHPLPKPSLQHSQANYVILSYLPWPLIIKLQALSKRFYNSYVPTALMNVPA